MEKIEQCIFVKLQRGFSELRDELLSASQELAKSQRPDWAEAERLFTASKKVDDLCRSVLTPVEDHQASDVGVQLADVNGAETPLSADRTSRKKSKKDYPKYAVRSDGLIKIGLSRDRRTEYEHTVPHPEFDAVAQRLGELAGRKHFSADDVITKVPCPSYQTYIVISLFKDRGLVTVPRRGMYAFARPRSFPNEAQAIWDSLAKTQLKNSND